LHIWQIVDWLGSRLARRTCGAAVIWLGLQGFAFMSAAQAGDAGEKTAYAPWRETWVGGEMLAHSWSVYTGSTVALTGDINSVGWRLRSTGGYGQYTYRKLVRGLDGPENVTYTGRKTFSDALLGYHFQVDKLILKAFAGVSVERHIIDPRDPDNSVAGFTYGAKAALEAWLSISDRQWIAGNLALSSNFNTYKMGLRTGYKPLENLNIGIETRFEGNDAYHAGRAGGFVTIQVGDASATLSGGVTGDRDMRTSHYLSVNLYLKY